MDVLYYVLVFFASLLVDIVPFFGPPAWIVMVFFQLHYGLDIWWVLIAGVLGSALGRYILALYMPAIGNKVLNRQKDEDLQFLGSRMNTHFWKTQLFVLFYTLLPIPSTPLFTVVGLSRMNPMRVIFAFFTGKFTSDALMVYAGKFAAENVESLLNGLLEWKTLSGVLVGIILVFIILFIDWHHLLLYKKFRLSFHIFK